MKIVSVGRLVIGGSWAKSWSWHDTAKSGDKIIHCASICTVRRGDDSALRVIIGPASLTLGYIRQSL